MEIEDIIHELRSYISNQLSGIYGELILEKVGEVLYENGADGPKSLRNKLIGKGVFEHELINKLIYIINKTLRMKNQLYNGDPILSKVGFYWKSELLALQSIYSGLDHLELLNLLYKPTVPVVDYPSWNRIRCTPFTSIFTSTFNLPQEVKETKKTQSPTSGYDPNWVEKLAKCLTDDEEKIEISSQGLYQC